MGQEIATNKDGFNVPERSGTSLIVGGKIKFVDGIYKVDKVQVLPPETTLVAIDVTTCWVKWKGGKPVEHRITKPGQTHPRHDDLPDQDEALWEPGLNGEPVFPWKDTRYLRLIHPLTGAEYTFITDSAGGRTAVAKLKDQTLNIRFVQPNAVPLIKFGSVPMTTKYGTKKRPDFEVVEWRGGTSAPSQSTPQIEQADADDDDVSFDDTAEIPF